MKADETLDCTGLLCPMPIAQAAMKLKKMAKGQTLEVIADDAGIKADMPAWCRATGNELVEMREEDGKFRLLVKKTNQ